jgi:hypothetical protein
MACWEHLAATLLQFPNPLSKISQGRKAPPEKFLV